MGNQQIRRAMSGVLDRDFDVTQLDSFEARLWWQCSFDDLKEFEEEIAKTENMNKEKLHPISSEINIEKS